MMMIGSGGSGVAARMLLARYQLGREPTKAEIDQLVGAEVKLMKRSMVTPTEWRNPLCRMGA